MQKPLSYETLGDLDGGAARAIIDAAIAEALLDLDDRGIDEQPRKVEILVTLKQMDSGQVVAHVEANPKLPRRRTAGTMARLKSTLHNGKKSTRLLFQDGAPDDPDQRTIDETYRPQSPTETEE